MALVETAASELFTSTEDAHSPTGVVRVGVHDASRLEWSVSVPLPERGELEYAIEVEIAIPSNAFAPHEPWSQMQAFTRLDGPALLTGGEGGVTIDALRRGALAFAGRLSRTGDDFARHCRLAGSLFATGAYQDLGDALVQRVDAAVALTAEARDALAEPRAGDPAELSRERRLVDEYVSVRLLEMLAGAERALATLSEGRAAANPAVAEAVAVVEAVVGASLEHELVRREAQAYVCADPRSPQALERYLERASRLKKHFQEVLFLEAESIEIAKRAYHWVAGFVAALASIWAFVWQLTLIDRGTSFLKQGVGSGLVTVAIVAGLIYATKDRFKEIGRNWVTRRMHQVYGGQRITRYRAPARRLPGRDVVVNACESFDQCLTHVPDALNPESGASTTVTTLRYQHKGTVVSQRELLRSGVRRVKHVFRYDLSPIFARLDDATKPVPVLDEKTRRVRFIDAPRCYRVPVHVRVLCGGQEHDEVDTLFVHKRGLERLERQETRPDSGTELTDLDPS